MRRERSGWLMVVWIAVVAGSVTAATAYWDPRFEKGGPKDARQRAVLATNDPGCEAPQLVSTGGPVPKDPQTLALRWTGYGNFELVYNGQILLLDAYFDRGNWFPPLGFKAADIKKANAILIGHGHVDHMSDAASVGARTGALVVGAPVTTEKLLTQSIDPKQVKTVTGKGGELLEFKGLKVEPILGRHGDPPPEVAAAFRKTLGSFAKPLTPEQEAESKAIRARGTSDRRVLAEGTIAYLITLDNGFRIMFRDSGGAVTEYEKKAMERVGRVDVALVAVSASFLQNLTVPRALEHMRTYKPDVYLPAHHDSDYNALWRSTEPLFQGVKDEFPNIVTVSKGYREPICFDTSNNLQHR
jgi:L-ascorbate metabolism protein UlaG (beta-lactamase superfamily)